MRSLLVFLRRLLYARAATDPPPRPPGGREGAFVESEKNGKMGNMMNWRIFPTVSCGGRKGREGGDDCWRRGGLLC